MMTKETSPPTEMLFGEEVTDEVLRLQLDRFEGPFDVLLFLIEKQEIDIFDIPIVKITEQYLRFLELLKEERLDVVGDFLVMAATLIQIKSRLLVPHELEQEEEEVEEEDPRLELLEKLLEFRRYRDLTQIFQKLEERSEDFFFRNAKPEIEKDPEEEEYFEATLYDLVNAFRRVLHFFNQDLTQTIVGEGHSVDEKIERIEHLLDQYKSISWRDLVHECSNKVELVCCLLAILELCRMGHVLINQNHTFADIRLFQRTATEAVE